MNYFQFVFVFVTQKDLPKLLGLSYKDNISHHSFWQRIKRAAGTILHKFKIEKHKYGQAEILNSKVWFFANTVNQFYAIRDIQENMMIETGYLLLASNKKMLELTKDKKRLIVDEARIRKYWYKLPLFLIKSLIYSPYFTYRYLDAIVSNFGYREIYTEQLRKHKPEMIVLSHDHLPMYRTLVWTAKSMGVRTVYIQHAAVSDLFPPLSFDLAILDGRHSFEKYKVDRSCNTIVKMIGSAKYDNHFKYRKRQKRLNVIGICYNPLDEVNSVFDLVSHLSTLFDNKRIVIRTHPRDNRRLDIGKFKNVTISDAQNESAIDFLREIDVLISGNSTMLLEATAMNILAIYFPAFSSNKMVDDYYGFVSNGVAMEASNYDSLVGLIKSEFDKDVYLNAKYYINNIGEPYEGRVSCTIADFINDYLSKKIIN